MITLPQLEPGTASLLFFFLTLAFFIMLFTKIGISPLFSLAVITAGILFCWIMTPTIRHTRLRRERVQMLMARARARILELQDANLKLRQLITDFKHRNEDLEAKMEELVGSDDEGEGN